ncbi:MAG: hypothetical protein K5768_07855 [Firmicutes bacterium]|nr:hypothetical protein [Bacillota bacterium]
MKKMSKKFMACVIAISLLAAVLPAAAFAEGTYGAVALETKLDNDIVVYENHFADEAAFNAVYNKDVDYGIHPINAAAGSAVKFTYQSNFTGAGLAAANYESTQIRTYNGDPKTKAKGFWIDLDKVLEDYGPGAYSFSFRVNSPASPGLIEAVLNTAEDQSLLGDIIWGVHDRTESSPYVNLGGHVLCRRWTESSNGNNNQDPLNNVRLSSTTYVPEGSEHLRFFFGGTIFDGAADSRNVGGGAGWKPVFFDDLVITKKANGYQDTAIVGGTATLKSTLTSLDGNVHTGYLISAVYDNTNDLLYYQQSDVITVGGETPTEQPIISTVNLPSTGGYTIKTFFWDDFENITPYCISSKPHDSLMPNSSFETPFANSAYRWTESGSNLNQDIEGAAYTGQKGVAKGISAGGTYIRVNEGPTLSPGTSGAPGSPTALANTLLENGKGRYKISFMAKTEDEVNASVLLQIRPYYMDYGKLDTAIGTLDKDTTRDTTAVQTASNEWSKLEYTVDFTPMPSGRTVGSSNSGWLSYRKNNYGLLIVASNANTTLYIDDFKVEKICDLP